MDFLYYPFKNQFIKTNNKNEKIFYFYFTCSLDGDCIQR